MNLIPYDKAIAQTFENKLKRIPAFQNSEQFILVFNKELVNSRNSENSKIARELVDVYINAKLVGHHIVILSEHEIIADNAMFLLEKYKVVATLQRIGNEIIHENYSDDVMLVFKQDNDGELYVQDSTLEEPIIYSGAEKIKNLNELISSNIFLIPLIKPLGEQDASIMVQDLLKIDMNFISAIGDILKEDFQ